MTPSNDETLNRDVPSGTVLIAGALAMVVVMILHPTGGAINKDNYQSLALVNVAVHSLGLAAVPTIFLGLLGLARRLRGSNLAIAALVAYGFGGVAVLSAAVASGFVITSVVDKIFTGPADARPVLQTLLTYTGLINQGFAKVNLVGSSVAVVLFSAGIWRSGRLSRAAALFGAIIGIGLLVPFLAGRLTLDTHGFGIATFAQSAWLTWVGALLCQGESPV